MHHKKIHKHYTSKQKNSKLSPSRNHPRIINQQSHSVSTASKSALKLNNLHKNFLHTNLSSQKLFSSTPSNEQQAITLPKEEKLIGKKPCALPTHMIVGFPGFKTSSDALKRFDHNGNVVSELFTVKLFPSTSDYAEPPVTISLPTETSVLHLSTEIAKQMPTRPSFVSFSTKDKVFIKDLFVPTHPIMAFRKFYNNFPEILEHLYKSRNDENFIGIPPVIMPQQFKMPTSCQPFYNNPSGAKLNNISTMFLLIQDSDDKGEFLRPDVHKLNKLAEEEKLVDTNNEQKSKQKQSLVKKLFDIATSKLELKSQAELAHDYFSDGLEYHNTPIPAKSTENNSDETNKKNSLIPKFFYPNQKSWPIHPYTPLYDMILSSKLYCHVSYTTKQVENNPSLAKFIKKCQLCDPQMVISQPPYAKDYVIINYRLGDNGKVCDYSNPGSLHVSSKIIVGLIAALVLNEVIQRSGLIQSELNPEAKFLYEKMLDYTQIGDDMDEKTKLFKQKNSLESTLNFLQAQKKQVDFLDRFKLWRNNSLSFSEIFESDKDQLSTFILNKLDQNKIADMEQESAKDAEVSEFTLVNDQVDNKSDTNQ